MQKGQTINLMALRLLGEFAVIIVGVLVALAADRWNQARLATDTELLYLDRLAADVRADSVEAAKALDLIPEARAARDSLLRAVDREAALPQDLASAVFRAWGTVRLPPPTTWGELTSSGAAIVISDVDLRQSLSEYYAARTEAEYYLASAELRGRYPFVTAMYPIGLLEQPVRADAPRRFVEWPGIRDHLIALGGHYYLMGVRLPMLVDEAATVLHEIDRVTTRMTR